MMFVPRISCEQGVLLYKSAIPPVVHLVYSAQLAAPGVTVDGSDLQSKAQTSLHATVEFQVPAR